MKNVVTKNMDVAILPFLKTYLDQSFSLFVERYKQFKASHGYFCSHFKIKIGNCPVGHAWDDKLFD